jgi:hypothetical protein
MANLQRKLANPNNKNSLKPVSGFLVPAGKSDTKYARLAGALIAKTRRLFDKPALELDTLKQVATDWADELIGAGCPPRLWETIFRIAGFARPWANKGFMVTSDQVIGAWYNYLIGNQWDDGEQAWRPYYPPITYCGKCEKGHVAIKVSEDVYGPRTVHKDCECKIQYWARNSHHFRRFSASYELRYGTPYEASESDLASLYRLKDEIENRTWGNEVDKYFSGAENPTLEAFCATWVDV